MPMERPPQRDEPPPATTIQAAGRAALAIVEGLRTQPMLLGILILNVVFVLGSAYLLGKQSDRRAEVLQTIIKECFEHMPKG